MSDREDLIKSYKTGNFLETVDAISLNDRTERSVLAMELATLHNDGLIDVVEAFEPLRNSSSNGPNFFLTLHAFEEVLPNLNASIPTVMQCVLQLYHKAGQDMASGMILESFIAFCTKEPIRPHEALMEIEANPDKFADLLTAVLIAGSRIDNPSYFTKAIHLCEDKDIELRRRAVFALGKLNCLESNMAAALAALERSVTIETDDQILASIVKSAFAFLQQDKNQVPYITILIGNALSKGNEYTLHAASELFGFNTDTSPSFAARSIKRQQRSSIQAPTQNMTSTCSSINTSRAQTPLLLIVSTIGGARIFCSSSPFSIAINFCGLSTSLT